VRTLARFRSSSAKRSAAVSYTRSRQSGHSQKLFCDHAEHMAKRQLVAIEHTMRFEDYAVQSKSANIGQQPKRKPPLQRRLI